MLYFLKTVPHEDNVDNKTKLFLFNYRLRIKTIGNLRVTGSVLLSAWRRTARIQTPGEGRSTGVAGALYYRVYLSVNELILLH